MAKRRKRRSSFQEKYLIVNLFKNNRILANILSSCSPSNNDRSKEITIDKELQPIAERTHSVEMCSMEKGTTRRISTISSNRKPYKQRESEVDLLYNNLAFIFGYTGKNCSYEVNKVSRPFRIHSSCRKSDDNLDQCKTKKSQKIHKRRIEKEECIKSRKSKRLNVGDLVIGDIKKFGWWYGKIVKHDKKPSAKHLVWVFWFGDHKILQYPLNYLKPYKEFPSVFSQVKMKRPLYRTAVMEFIFEVKDLYLQLKLPLPDLENVPKRRVFSELLCWAKDGFVVLSSTSTSEGSDGSVLGNLNPEKDAISESKDCSGETRCKYQTESVKRITKCATRTPPKNMQTILNEIGTDEEASVDQMKVNDIVSSNGHDLPLVDCNKTSDLMINSSKHESGYDSSIYQMQKTTQSTEFEDKFPNHVHSVTIKNGASTCHKSLTLCDNELVDVPDTMSEVLFDALDDMSECLDSDSTISYRIIESESENTPKYLKESVKLLKRKRGGIELDINLIGTVPTKRHSSTKAEEAFRTKKPEKRINARSTKAENVFRTKALGHRSLALKKKESLLNLPVQTSRSKVLSWNTNLPFTSTPKKSIGGNDIQVEVNDLIIGKLTGFNWWFGKVISHKEARKRRPADGMCWVYWYGDSKLSQMPLKSLELLDKFPIRFLHKKRGLYLTAVEEVLTEAAYRSNKVDLPDRFDKQNRLNALVEWALGGFQPLGVSGFRCAEAGKDGTNTSNDSVSNDGTIDSVRPRLNKDVKMLFDKVVDGLACIEDLCLACGDTSIVTQHPLFEGGLCRECKESFLECAYLYDDNGCQMYCCICSDGDRIILCDNTWCSRSYCPVCIDTMCGVGYTKKISQQEHWKCFMCTGEGVRLLHIRYDWKDRMKEIFSGNDPEMDFGPQITYDPVPRDQQKPIRVLSLFDGIATACFVLKKLNLQIGSYYAAEVDPDATKVSQKHHGETIIYIRDVCDITRSKIEEWGPFDLVVGGSPCNDLSIANPARQGIYGGTGRLFFEFYRLLTYAKPTPVESRPFFWLFENVVGMRHTDREVISRFLQCNPVVVDAKDVSAQNRSRYFWGNLPGMDRPSCNLESSSLVLQDCLEGNCGRVAKFDKVGCITTMRHSLRQTKKSFLPVELEHSFDGLEEDVLWLTEIERIFGFPEHYTDVGNMGHNQRQKLLGKCWSVPVIEHLLMPLKDYFKLNDAPLLTNTPVVCDSGTPVMCDSGTQTEEMMNT